MQDRMTTVRPRSGHSFLISIININSAPISLHRKTEVNTDTSVTIDNHACLWSQQPGVDFLVSGQSARHKSFPECCVPS
jgi:hypothetical protein